MALHFHKTRITLLPHAHTRTIDVAELVSPATHLCARIDFGFFHSASIAVQLHCWLVGACFPSVWREIALPAGASDDEIVLAVSDFGAAETETLDVAAVHALARVLGGAADQSRLSLRRSAAPRDVPQRAADLAATLADATRRTCMHLVPLAAAPVHAQLQGVLAHVACVGAEAASLSAAVMLAHALLARALPPSLALLDALLPDQPAFESFARDLCVPARDCACVTCAAMRRGWRCIGRGTSCTGRPPRPCLIRASRLQLFTRLQRRARVCGGSAGGLRPGRQDHLRNPISQS